MLRSQRINELEVVTSDIFPCRNLFTTRIGGVSEGEFATLNLGSARGDNLDHVKENYRRVCEVFDVGVDDAVVTMQVHGNDVRYVTSKDKHVCLSKVPYETDGIVTDEKGLLLMCFTADCVPALLADKEGHAVAAVHCGWRSSVADILNVAITKMCDLGAKRENITVALGPAIGKCCFECDYDVVDAINKYIGKENVQGIEKKGEKYYIDLRLVNTIRLKQLGIKEENIDVSDECTVCLHDKYWSHRYTQKNNLKRGNLAAAIML